MTNRPKSPNSPKSPRRSDPWIYLTQLLRHRPRSIEEARQRLTGHGYEPQDVEATVNQAITAGLLDDAAFAKLWVRDRVWHHPISRAAVRQELFGKGIASSLVSDTLEAEYPQVKEPELAYELAAKRCQRLLSVPLEKRRDRVVRFLMRRGFSASQSRTAVRRAEEEPNG